MRWLDERRHRRQEPGELVRADHLTRRRLRPAAAVAGHARVRGQQRGQGVHVARSTRTQEAMRDLATPYPIRLVPWPPRRHVLPSTPGDLAYRRLLPLDHLGDLAVPQPERLPQHEHRSLY